MMNDNNTMGTSNTIDWEQRRYEIARDIYPVMCHHMDPRAYKTAPAKAAVELADILIDELQRKKP